jgi:ActR/RegA family two-component response regulator
MHLLIVSSNTAIRQGLIKAFLGASRKIKVQQASGAESALTIINNRRGSFDAIVATNDLRSGSLQIENNIPKKKRPMRIVVVQTELRDPPQERQEIEVGPCFMERILTAADVTPRKNPV